MSGSFAQSDPQKTQEADPQKTQEADPQKTQEAVDHRQNNSYVKAVGTLPLHSN